MLSKCHCTEVKSLLGLLFVAFLCVGYLRKGQAHESKYSQQKPKALKKQFVYMICPLDIVYSVSASAQEMFSLDHLIAPGHLQPSLPMSLPFLPLYTIFFYDMQIPIFTPTGNHHSLEYNVK